jgi:hypothetical protein
MSFNSLLNNKLNLFNLFDNKNRPNQIVNKFNVNLQTDNKFNILLRNNVLNQNTLFNLSNDECGFQVNSNNYNLGVGINKSQQPHLNLGLIYNNLETNFLCKKGDTWNKPLLSSSFLLGLDNTYFGGHIDTQLDKFQKLECLVGYSNDNIDTNIKFQYTPETTPIILNLEAKVNDKITVGAGLDINICTQKYNTIGSLSYQCNDSNNVKVLGDLGSKSFLTTFSHRVSENASADVFCKIDSNIDPKFGFSINLSE